MGTDVGTIQTAKLLIPWINAEVTYNPTTMFFTGIVALVLVALALFAARAVRRGPSKGFATVEMMYTGFLDMAKEAMGEDARKFTPLVVTIFVFVLLCNWLSIIPGLKSPTEDLNTCLGLGILVFIVAHVSAIAKKGIGKYLKNYCEPFIFFLPINVIGEIGKVISHSFRLFGNIFAGAVIFALIGPVIIKTFNAIGLPTYSASPAIFGAYFAAQVFFGLFVGGVQALVFALLALTYIAILRE